MNQVNDLVRALEDAKALEIVIIDIRNNADFADYFIICSATSNRHAKTIADNCALAAKMGNYLHHFENDPQMSWLIIDCYNVIVHIMQPDTRAFYQLENLWQLEPDHEPDTKKN
jgi:ribosome-associated protein